MRCLVINLPLAWERREAIEHEFSKVGLTCELWPAEDGHRLTDENHRSIDHDGRRRGGEAPEHVGAGWHGSGRDRARGRAEAARAAARSGRSPSKRAVDPAGIGRYGPWVRHGATYAAIPEGEDVLTVHRAGRRRGGEAPEHVGAGRHGCRTGSGSRPR